MFYLLVVAALGEELRSRKSPGEKSHRTATRICQSDSHVDRHENGAASKLGTNTERDRGLTYLLGGGANGIISAHVNSDVAFTESN